VSGAMSRPAALAYCLLGDEAGRAICWDRLPLRYESLTPRLARQHALRQARAWARGCGYRVLAVAASDIR
jgi:hypothetical protein